MALAEITYNAGLSCQIGSTRFHLNRTILVKDPNVIARAQVTKGFSVHIVGVGATTKKKTRKVVRGADGQPKRATKKTTKKKTSRK